MALREPIGAVVNQGARGTERWPVEAVLLAFEEAALLDRHLVCDSLKRLIVNVGAGSVMISPPSSVSGSIQFINDTLEINCEGRAVLTVSTTSAATSGVVGAQATIDGVRWFSLDLISVNLSLDGPEPRNTVSANGEWATSVAGFSKARLIVSLALNASLSAVLRVADGPSRAVPLRIDQRFQASTRKYQISLVLNGSAVAGTNLAGLRQLAANDDCWIERIEVMMTHAAVGIGNPIRFQRATTVAGGTLIAAADVPKVDTNALNATTEVRTGAVTGTKANQPFWIAGGNTVVTTSQSGPRYVWAASDRSQCLRLTADQGIIIDQGPLVGDADDRYIVTFLFEEG